MLVREVKKEEAHQSLEKYVKKVLMNAPLSFIYKLFRKKDIKVNGHWQNAKYVLKEGDVVSFYVKDEQYQEFMSSSPSIKGNNQLEPYIVYEDNNILLINKPRGLLVQPDEKNNSNCLSNMVLSYLIYKNEYDSNEVAFTPGPAHRIDRNTSGLVIFGKNIASLQELYSLFHEKTNLGKHYITLVKGEIYEDGEVNAPLKKDSENNIVKVASLKSGGKPAISKYRVLENYEGYTLLDVVILTGRTHQIRVHMSYINHPVIGDNKYGDFETNRFFKTNYHFANQFLHAYELDFGDLKEPLSYLSHKKFIAPLLEEYKSLLSYLVKCKNKNI